MRVMDEQTKLEWKWKFYKLAILLNAIVICFAVAIVSIILFPDPFRIPCFIIALAIALVLSRVFTIQYRAAKVWLDEHAGTKKEIEKLT
jgi:hypothetical protein